MCLGGILGGVGLFVDVGLFEGWWFIIYWYYLDELCVKYFNVLIECCLFVLDCDWFICVGGMVLFDMMYVLIVLKYGSVFV